VVFKFKYFKLRVSIGLSGKSIKEDTSQRPYCASVLINSEFIRNLKEITINVIHNDLQNDKVL